MDWRLCDQCEKEESTFYCRECQLKYCESCNGIFHSKGALKAHHVQALQSRTCQSCSNAIAIHLCNSCDIKFCDPCWSRWHSKGTLQSHKKQGLLQEATDESRPLEEDVTVISSSMPDDVGIPKRLQKASLGFIPNPKGKRSLYYMSIMKEAHTKMRKDGESDESFKKRFTAEQSRQFDLLMSEEAAFQRADGCSERLGELLQPEYQLRPSDGRRLNYVIKEHKEAVEKLKGLVKILSDHDSMLFQANGITLNHDKKFHHDFNVEHIARIETKLLNVSGELENLEKKKETFDQIFKGLTGNYASKKRKLKENRRKSKSRKRKRFENNVRRVYHICVANPLAKELPSCLLYPPSLTIPEACINVEDVAAVLLTRDAAFIAHLLQSNYFSNAAGSRLITNLKPEVRNRMYCFLHPEDYSSNVGDTNKDEEENDEEEEEGEDNEEEQEGEEDEDSDDEIKGNVENDELDTL